MRTLWSLVVVMVLSSTGAQARTIPSLDLSAAQLEWIGGQIYRNECQSRPACLVHWNQGEAFPSLGIGHFIWYPAGQTGPYVESFPSLVSYMQEQGANLPSWLVNQAVRGAPWADRAEFLGARERGDPRIAGLQHSLASQQGLQAAFMAARARSALSEVIAASDNPDATRRKIEALVRTPGGVYGLVDYVNFKGEGLSTTEQYEGVGWGLRQVLDAMPATPPDDLTALDAFRRAAAGVLTRRAELSGRSIEKQQWLPGWLNRLDTYREPTGQ